MGDSIAAAVRATAQSPGWLILPADLPLVQSATLRAIAAALEGCDAVVPVFAGQRGHPVGFSARCRDALLNLSGSKGAASVLLAYRSTECVVADPGCVMDIDTVDDLIAAHKFLNQGLGSAIQP
jgi:molybdenum cofactor cytidylyltransferase